MDSLKKLFQLAVFAIVLGTAVLTIWRCTDPVDLEQKRKQREEDIKNFERIKEQQNTKPDDCPCRPGGCCPPDVPLARR